MPRISDIKAGGILIATGRGPRQPWNRSTRELENKNTPTAIGFGIHMLRYGHMKVPHNSVSHPGAGGQNNFHTAPNLPR